jgi:organic hydroperoxide reductase OsmC/OhrA
VEDSRVHRYQARCSWRGSTAAGYDGYGRAHEASAPPAAAVMTLSADPAFRGDPTLLDPEQLLVLAAVSCQLLSFLAVAARARVDVLEYDDHGEGEMDLRDHPARITRVALRPRIVLAAGPTRERVEHLVDVAHRECFIANSLRSEMTIEPEIVFS